MGENECLGWFPRYTPSKPTTIEDMEQDLHQNAIEYLQSLTRKQSNCSMRYEDGMIIVDEFTKCPIGVVAPQNDGIKPLSEDTAQRLDKAFKDLRKAVGGFPFFTLLSKRKARKHYKPKFTL